MNNIQSLAGSLAYDVLELQAIMSSLGRSRNFSFGFFGPEQEHPRDPSELSLSRHHTTGCQVVFYEIMAQRYQGKTRATVQTLGSFLDVEYDEPLIMAWFGARMAGEFGEDLDLLWESPSQLLGVPAQMMGSFLLAPYSSSVLSLHASFWHTPRLRFFSLEPEPSALLFGMRGGKAVVVADKTRSQSVDEEGAEAFELMAQAEAEEEARAELELDDSRTAYTLARPDDE